MLEELVDLEEERVAMVTTTVRVVQVVKQALPMQLPAHMALTVALAAEVVARETLMEPSEATEMPPSSLAVAVAGLPTRALDMIVARGLVAPGSTRAGPAQVVHFLMPSASALPKRTGTLRSVAPEMEGGPREEHAVCKTQMAAATRAAAVAPLAAVAAVLVTGRARCSGAAPLGRMEPMVPAVLSF